MFHAFGNNPITYTDPDGRVDAPYNAKLGDHDIFPTFKGINTGDKWYNKIFDAIVNDGLVGTYNLVASAGNVISNGFFAGIDLANAGIDRLDDLIPCDWTLSGGGLKADLDMISFVCMSNPNLMIQLSQSAGLCLKGLSTFGKTKVTRAFKSEEVLRKHFDKHGSQIGKLLDKSYTVEEYLTDANYIIDNGQYVPELNGYIKFIKGKNYGFVGIDRQTGEITTFHIKNVKDLSKLAPSLGFEP